MLKREILIFERRHTDYGDESPGVKETMRNNHEWLPQYLIDRVKEELNGNA